MDYFVFILMLIVPAVFAVVIHSYLRHGDMSGRRKILFFAIYIVLINLLCFAVSWVRGVHGFDMSVQQHI